MYHISPCFPTRQLLAWIALGLVPALADAADGPDRWTIVERSIDQDRLTRDSGRDTYACWLYWQVDYRLRNDGPNSQIVNPTELTAEVEAWVSNSRVPGHEVPRLVLHSLAGSSGLATTTEVVHASDDLQNCRERAELRVWPGHGEPPSNPEDPKDQGVQPPLPAFEVAPGETIRVRLRLEHQHFLHGPFDPLLGARTLALHLGPLTVRDTVPLERPLHVPPLPSTWGELPAERLDRRIYHSPPESLHLAAHVAGQRNFDFPDRPVRHNTPMRLSFSYLIAEGTQGRCRAEVRQYRIGARTYRILSEGKHEVPLKTVGRWVHVEQVIRTESEATTLKLRFVIDGDADVGELWIDDVTLEPLNARAEGP